MTKMLAIPLHELTEAQAARAGGKGANLGRLLRLGLPVPPGFVVTTDAYRAFIKANGLGEAAPAPVRGRIPAAPIPEEIGAAIVAAYRRLGAPAVAVRSSGTAEDLAAASFAGQHDTFLNVAGEEELLRAVRKCWASLWSERAVEYRRQHGIEDSELAIAVVVQRMVAAEFAGVLFTADPITGERDRLVVEAVAGLGEALVSGEASGRRAVVDKRSLRIIAQDALVPRRALREIGRLGRRIEAAFGGPQDIEWAWAGGRAYVLQARPMTALPEPPPRAGAVERLTAGLFAELVPSRPYPFDQTAWGVAVFGAVTPLFALLGIAVPPFDQLFAEEDGVVTRRREQLGIRPTPRVFLAPARVLRLGRRYDPRRWQADPLLAEAEARAHALEARDLRALTWDGLLAVIREAQTIPALVGEIRRRYFPRAALAAALLRLALALLGRRDRVAALLSGAETQTLAANRALEGLAARIRSDPALAAFAERDAGELRAALARQPAGVAFLAEFDRFLDRYGHREAAIALVSQPAWKDAPEVALGILQGLASAEPRPAPGRPAWEAARDELLRRPILRLPPARCCFLALLAAARPLLQIREDTHFAATLPMPVIRRTALEFGRRLVEAGVLAAPEEVFHLKLAELAALGGAWPPSPGRVAKIGALVRRRQERRAALADVPLVDPRLFSRASVGGDVLLSGAPGSPGVAEGPVRIIRAGAEFGVLRAGEVLVAPYTNPAWTPLFQRAVAVVVDSGSAGSHAAIVAREYGVPAVMATGTATLVLRDGQRVLVDGSGGRVLAR